MKLKFQKVVIVGPGLIGGSIGIFLRKNKIALPVVGVARHEYTLSNALTKGAIDEAQIDLKKAVLDADLVVIATPVLAFKKLIREIKNDLKPGCIVFDVGSAKREIVLQAQKSLPSRERGLKLAVQNILTSGSLSLPSREWIIRGQVSACKLAISK